MSSGNSILPDAQPSIEGFGKDTGLDHRWWHTRDNWRNINTAKRSLYQELPAYGGFLLFQTFRRGTSRNCARFGRPSLTSPRRPDSAGWTARNSGRISSPDEAQAIGENTDRARRRHGVHWDRNIYGLRHIHNGHFLSFHARPILDWDSHRQYRKISRLEEPEAH
jgi:hypothetical protein